MSDSDELVAGVQDRVFNLGWHVPRAALSAIVDVLEERGWRPPSNTHGRDELVSKIAEALNVDHAPDGTVTRADRFFWEASLADAQAAVEVMEAAGCRPPARVVTTVEELDALAVGTVIMEGDHGTPDDTGWGFKTMPGVFHRFPEGWHVVAGIGERAPDLPATVLWEPKEGSE